MRTLYLLLTLLVVTNGDLVFIGPGFNSFLSVELIDFSTDTPVSCDLPDYPLYNDDPVYNDVGGVEGAVINDKVTLCGGWYPDPSSQGQYENHVTDACHQYNPSTNTWEDFPHMLVERSEAKSITLPDGRWWMIGGDSFLVDSPQGTTTEILEDGSWVPGPILPGNWSGGCAAQLGEDVTLLAGGRWNFEISNKTWLYHWDTGVFEEVMGLAHPKIYHDCLALDDRNVMVTGGYTYGDGYFDTVEIFNLDSRTWSMADPLPEPNDDHRMVKEKEDVLVLGGTGAGWDGLPGPGQIFRYNKDQGWSVDQKQTQFKSYKYSAMVVTRDMLGC